MRIAVSRAQFDLLIQEFDLRRLAMVYVLASNPPTTTQTIIRGSVPNTSDSLTAQVAPQFFPVLSEINNIVDASGNTYSVGNHYTLDFPPPGTTAISWAPSGVSEPDSGESYRVQYAYGGPVIDSVGLVEIGVVLAISLGDAPYFESVFIVDFPRAIRVGSVGTI